MPRRPQGARKISPRADARIVVAADDTHRPETGGFAHPPEPEQRHHGFQRTDHPQPRQRRAHPVPAHGADTDGALLEFELQLTPDGKVPGAHVHPEQEERFHVLEGTMAFRLGFKKIVAGPGETVIVPAGARHKFANGGDCTARVRVEVEPALDMEQLLETTAELAHEGHTLRSGMPKPLHLALFVQRFQREVRAPFPPAWMVRVAMAPLRARRAPRAGTTRAMPRSLRWPSASAVRRDAGGAHARRRRQRGRRPCSTGAR